MTEQIIEFNLEDAVKIKMHLKEDPKTDEEASQT